MPHPELKQVGELVNAINLEFEKRNCDLRVIVDENHDRNDALPSIDDKNPQASDTSFSNAGIKEIPGHNGVGDFIFQAMLSTVSSFRLAR